MLRKITLLILCSLSFSYAQPATPLGDSLVIPSFNSASNNTKYCFHISQESAAVGFKYDSFLMGDQHGKVYVSFPQKWGIPEVIEYINGELYVASNYLRFISPTPKAYLTKYRNGSWLVLDSLDGVINTGTLHQGKMYYGGYINDTLRQLKNVVGLVNDSFSQVGQFSSVDSIFSLQSQSNELWAAGRFNLATNSDTAHIMVYDTASNLWSMPIKEDPSFSIGRKYLAAGFFFANRSYLIRDSTVYLVRNDSLISIYHLSLPADFHDWYKIKTVEINGKLYFNAGSDIIEYDNTNFRKLNPALGGYPITTILLFQNKIYGSFNSWWPTLAGLNYNYSFLWDPNPIYGSGMVQGKAFFDQNLNCQLDLGEFREIAFAMQLKHLQTGNQHVLAFHKDYSTILPAGSYQVDSIRTLRTSSQYLHRQPSCVGDTFHIDTVSNASTYDLAFRYNGPIDHAVSIEAASGRFRRGFRERVYLKVENRSFLSRTTPYNVEVILPPTVSYISGSLSPSQINGDTIEYSIPGLTGFSQRTIYLDMNVSMANAILDTLCLKARFLSFIDSVAANNIDSTFPGVVAAYDPNDKRPNLEESLPGLKQLDYHIRFQNTGTDTAYKVVVRDTLESYFDPFSIKLGSSSHSYQFQLEDENILVWTFDNILLPDSNTNPLGSQGFLKFQIDVDPNLPVGSIIDNDAEIYFDFQAPIHTNHAQTFIVDGLDQAENPSAPELKVYPNPFSDGITIETLRPDTEMKLFSSQGKLLGSFYFSEPGKHQLALSNLKTGVYILRSASSSYRILKQ